jgi:hypothetical protein
VTTALGIAAAIGIPIAAGLIAIILATTTPRRDHTDPDRETE